MPSLAYLVALRISTQFLNQVKINFISQLISGIVKLLQKLVKYFNDTTILTLFFAKLVCIVPPSIKFAF